MPKINLLHNSSSFAETDVQSTTIGALKNELDLHGCTINVNRTVVTDDFQLEDGQNVAAVSSNKTGGE
jgi:putative ubiquitin-RnfH superfamily antitoxin RatB of RatAB toxin-antitoxin module